jgi:AcrR family transcriptional regulator
MAIYLHIKKEKALTEGADGRLKRSVRSRKEIIDAMIVLMNSGMYAPTAQKIADEAGVSIRTLFRHFPEMDILYREVDEAIKPSYLHYFDKQLMTGPIEKRIISAVDARIMTYIETAHIEKATHSLLWRSKFIQENYRRVQTNIRKNLMIVLPELKKLSQESREMVEAVTSFEFFERLHTHQNVSEKACKKLILNLVSEQLGVK